jgi:hypothetical protein
VQSCPEADLTQTEPVAQGEEREGDVKGGKKGGKNWVRGAIASKSKGNQNGFLCFSCSNYQIE